MRRGRLTNEENMMQSQPESGLMGKNHVSHSTLVRPDGQLGEPVRRTEILLHATLIDGYFILN